MDTPDSLDTRQNGLPLANRPKPQIRGGFIVISRAVSSSRLTLKSDRPFEHSSRESALAEAARLAARHGREFAVFQEVGVALPPPARDEVAA